MKFSIALSTTFKQYFCYLMVNVRDRFCIAKNCFMRTKNKTTQKYLFDGSYKEKQNRKI